MNFVSEIMCSNDHLNQLDDYYGLIKNNQVEIDP